MSYSWGFRLTANKTKDVNVLNLQEAMQDENVLSGLSFELQAGDLMIVVGSVGSGKSSLLHGLMNETN